MPSQKKLAAIMFTDIVGYTRLMGEDENMAMDLVRTNRDIHKRLAKQYNGKLLKEIGDGNLLSFDSTSDAVSCGGAILDAAEEIEGLDLRVGIHQGEIIVENDDIYGDGVNIASRIESQAGANTVLVSDTVNRNIRNKGFSTQFVEEVELKNVEDPVKVYQVTGFPESISEDTKKKPRSLVYSAIAAISLIVAAGLWYFSSDTKEDIPLIQASGDESELTKADRIAVLPFDNRTGDDDFSSLGKMLSDWTTSLIYETGREIVSPKTVEQNIQFAGILPDTGSDRPAFSEVTGASKIIEGEYYLVDGNLRILARLISARTGEIIYQFEGLEDKVENANSLVEKTSQLIAGYLAVERTVNLGYLSPPNYKAYRAYENAQDAETREEFIEGLNKAIQLDSGFVKLYRHIGILFDGDVEKAKAAFRRHRPTITKYEEIVFDHYSARTGYERMLVIQRAYEMDPLEKETVYFYSANLLFQNYPAKALNVLKSAKLEPENYDPDVFWIAAPIWNTLSALFQQGNYEDCLQIIYRVPFEKRDEDLHGFTMRSMVRANFPASSLYSYIDSVDRFGNMEFTKDLWADLMQIAGMEAKTFNREDLAIPILQELLENWPDSFLPGAKPYTMLLVGDYVGAEKIYEQILSNRDSLDSIGRTEYHFFRLRMGITKAFLGQKEEAMEALRILEDGRDELTKNKETPTSSDDMTSGNYTYGMATIYANMGEQEKAMQLLEEAFDFSSRNFYTAPNLLYFTWDPLLVSMQDYEPFIEFCKPKDVDLELN
jgi:class 3 adenylate cyclase/tetratricopeptide (TPR) repeat protein